MRAAILPVVSLLGCGGEGASSPPAGLPNDAAVADAAPPDAAMEASSSGAVRFAADAWADNWFSAYLGDRLLKEDSVPITTERSFNAESFAFEATYPFVLSFVLKDFIQNDSGLEYIGAANQQIGDGGFVFQLREADSGKTVLVSSAAWRCMVIQKAPLNPTCEKDPDPLSTCKFQRDPEPLGWHASTCDGKGESPPLVWSGVPAGTAELALLMTTEAKDGRKWNWVLFGIPAGTTALSTASVGVGTCGLTSDGPALAYSPPCSAGPGAKAYTFSLYALSGKPVLPAAAKDVTGPILTAAIAPLTLATSTLTANHTR